MNERLSALIDDELGMAETEGCLDRLDADRGLRETWGVYHLIGDALRGGAGPGLPPSFAERLAAEPTVLAPGRAVRPAPRTVWYALSAAASVAAVALVGWMALPLFDPPVRVAGPQSPPVVAAADVMPVPEVKPAAVPNAQDVNDYLLAHQRFSPSSAMGGIAAYVRTVSEDREAR
ncbi:MAG TPA: sigma-E factor negative regulatory protein [Burkholderiales bacterium]|jgi:sigma-E factor negative regulatory protein RseA|nr:sigma-E factor negative regulatory protein [Burkholderiales bacterium]